MAAELMRDSQRALDEQVREELKIGEAHATPFKEGWLTGVSTAVGAFIPVAPTAVDTPVNHPSLNGVACASPIFSSSRTCSSSARCESRITSAAILRAIPPSMPLA